MVAQSLRRARRRRGIEGSRHDRTLLNPYLRDHHLRTSGVVDTSLDMHDRTDREDPENPDPHQRHDPSAEAAESCPCEHRPLTE